jgi:sugar O-acyltransferase (sialic acid O-acetyltransferase NeuD family)
MLINKNILLGYSGHGYVVADAAFEAGITIGFYADKNEASKNPFKLDYIGYEKDKNFEYWNKGCEFILGIGSNKIRSNLAGLVLKKGEKLLTIIHPGATVAKSVQIGDGTFIAAQSAINAFTKLGDYAIINTGSIVEHECSIADGVHIAPGAVLAGNVSVGRHTFIGANAVIKEGVSIGSNVIVGAGSTIINDISSGKKVVGSPGKEI